MTDAYSPKYAAVGFLPELILQQMDVAEMLKRDQGISFCEAKKNYITQCFSVSQKNTPCAKLHCARTILLHYIKIYVVQGIVLSIPCTI